MKFIKRKRFWIPAATLLLPVVSALLYAAVFFLGLERAEAAPPREATPATERQIAQGKIVGFSTPGGMDLWTAIPYAAPVDGDRRWTMPEPAAGWDGSKSFITDPDPCPQFAGQGMDKPKEGYLGVENCLTLNVMAPSSIKDLATAKLPVMVWIHGGGNSIGAAGNLDRNLLVPEQNVILVTLQYRLGPLGFFSHSALREAGIETANFGLEDQILGLKWVQQNIAAFGGDPDNVTVFGQSAGARNVFSLILSPHAKGLFHKAILESGTSTTVPRALAETPEGRGGARNNSADIVAKLLVRLGKAEDMPKARALARDMGSAALVEFMKQVPLRDLLEVYQKHDKDFMFMLPSAIRDGFTLPDADPSELWGDPGKSNTVPTIVGHNQNELGMLLLFSGQFGKPGMFKIPQVDDDAGYMRVASYLSRVWKFTGVDRTAGWQAKAGAQPVYVYRFDWNEEPTILGVDASRYVGAAHNFEVPFVLGQFEGAVMPRFFLTKKNAPGREKLSSEMREYWAGFARGGVPGAQSSLALPQWPQWQADAPVNMLLDTENDGGNHTASLIETRDAIEHDLKTDPDLEPKQKCFVLTMMLVSEVWSREEVNAMGLTQCQKLASGK